MGGKDQFCALRKWLNYLWMAKDNHSDYVVDSNHIMLFQNLATVFSFVILNHIIWNYHASIF